MPKKILLAGESWQTTAIHAKGFDPFFSIEHAIGCELLLKAFDEKGYEVVHMPSHIAANEFPFTMEEISHYDCVILSDIGSNTILLPPETFRLGKRTPNRCDLIRDYVLAGGSLLMMGGYLTFTGIDGKARWGATSVADVLPVEMSPYDDRAEHPEGVFAQVADAAHPAVAGIDGDWPFLLGYNKVSPKLEAQVPVTIQGDPLIALGEFGKGRAGAFTSDCGPHWVPAEFTGWTHWARLWDNMLRWLTKG
ncbi:MAG: glutamine amidotransferase [Oscillospiraceae bacterium]|nr:glutamine amidotransferase [Oscillospiraceae bacterium]